MKKLEMNNYESPLFMVYEVKIKRSVMNLSGMGVEKDPWNWEDDDDE